jgi:hypothetical protein
MITVSITLTLAGVDTGPTFNLYSNVGGYTTAFATGVSKAALQAGYISTVVPDGTTIIRVSSVGTCNTSVDLNVITSTTTTTTVTPTPTTTTTTTTVIPTPTTTTTTTPAPSAATSIRTADQETGSEPVICSGTVPPTEGTEIYYTTFVVLQDQFGNPIAATSNITVVLGYEVDPCGSSSPIFSETHNVIIVTGQSTGSYTYTKSTLVDCGQSNCLEETRNYTGPVSNTAGLPFV